MEYEFFKNNYDDILSVAKTGLSEGYDEFKRVEKGKKKTVAKDKGEEDVYGAGVKKGEQIEKKKMKKSELKAKIKEMIVSEMNVDLDKMEDAPASEVDFLSEIEAMLNENSPMDDPRVEQIISMLKDLDVDGETMEYILRQVGMEDQMANQLVHYPAEYAASLNEAEGLTPLQDYVYQYEIEVSGEDNAQEYLDDIKGLNSISDVQDYYGGYRGWAQDRDFKYDLQNLIKNLKRKFPNLSSDELTPLQKQAYSYAKERFGFEDAKNSLDQIKTLTTREEFSDWVQKKIEAEKGLNEAAKEKTAKEVFRSIEANDLLNDRREYDVEDLMVAYPGLSEKEAEKLEDMLQNPNLDEAEDTEKDTAETDATDVTVDDTETTDVTTTTEVDPNVKAVQDALTQAQAAAEKLGDKKLTDQIGNTITFFTRSHVVEKPGTVA